MCGVFVLQYSGYYDSDAYTIGVLAVKPPCFSWIPIISCVCFLKPYTSPTSKLHIRFAKSHHIASTCYAHPDAMLCTCEFSCVYFWSRTPYQPAKITSVLAIGCATFWESAPPYRGHVFTTVNYRAYIWTKPHISSDIVVILCVYRQYVWCVCATIFRLLRLKFHTK